METVKRLIRLPTRIAKQIKATTMNILSWSVETWKVAFELAAIVAGALTAGATVLTVASLIGILLTGREINRLQAIDNKAKADRILILEKEAADAKRKLLEAEERARPRRISFTAVAAALKGRATGVVGISCDASVPDAYDPLGMEIRSVLEQAGWTVISLVSTPAPPARLNTREYARGRSAAPRIRQGVTIEGVLDDCEGEKDTPYCSLRRAFEVSGLEFQTVLNVKIPKDTFGIIIGPRPLLPPETTKESK